MMFLMLRLILVTAFLRLSFGAESITRKHVKQNMFHILLRFSDTKSIQCANRTDVMMKPMKTLFVPPEYRRSAANKVRAR